MKNAYPIMMSQSNEYVIVYIPDFDINTKGKDYAEAIAMARDAIGLIRIGIEDDGKPLPAPSSVSTLQAENSDKLVLLLMWILLNIAKKMICGLSGKIVLFLHGSATKQNRQELTSLKFCKMP